MRAPEHRDEISEVSDRFATSTTDQSLKQAAIDILVDELRAAVGECEMRSADVRAGKLKRCLTAS